MNAPRLRAFLLLLAPWALLTLGLNSLLGGDIVRQLRMLGAPSVPGTILSSAVEEVERGGDETLYRFAVRYRYTVAGTTFESERYRLNPWRSDKRSGPAALAARHRPGDPVRVSYWPEAPQDAVLLRGLEGADLHLLLAGAGFVLLCFLGAYGLHYAARGPEAHVAAVVVGGRTRITLNPLHPALIGWSVMAGGALVLYPLVGVPTGFCPSMTTAVLYWGLVLASGTFFTWRADARLRTGEWDVIFDEGTRRLSLPPMRNETGVFERPQRLELEWARVRDITLERHITQDHEGHIKTLHRPTVHYVDERGQLQQEPILEWQLEGRASALVGWLQSRLDRAPLDRAS